MLLYIVGKDNIGDWNIEPGKSYTVKNQLFESDIYCDFLTSALEFTELPNHSAQILLEDSSNLPELHLLTNDGKSDIAGSFCALNDIWLDVGDDNALVISTQVLNLTPTSLDRIKRTFRSNVQYNLSPQPTTTTSDADKADLVKAENADSGSLTSEATPSNISSDNTATNMPAEAAVYDSTAEQQDPIMGSATTTTANTDDYNGMIDDESGLGGLGTANKVTVTKSNNTLKAIAITRPSIFKRFFSWLYRVLRLDSLADNKYVAKILILFNQVGVLIKQNKMLTGIIFIMIVVMIISILLVIGFNNDSEVGIHVPGAANSYDEQTLLNERRIKQLTAKLPIVNGDVYQQYNHFVISGLVVESAMLDHVKTTLKSSLTGIPMELHLFSLEQVQDGVDALEDDFQLNCNYDPHLARVTCFGMVNDKDNAKEQIFNEYQYNEVLPLSLDLLSNLEVQTYLKNAFASQALVNVRYTLSNDGVLTLSGYISEYKLHYLDRELHQILEKIPFLEIQNKLRIIERDIDLQIKQIIFNDYGNTLVDADGNEYNVGSQYKNFIITSIQKNSIVLRSGVSTIITLATPFNTDTLETPSVYENWSNLVQNVTNESTSPLNMNTNSYDGLMGDIPPIIDSNFSTGSEANADSKSIIKAEVAKQIADVNEKKQILDELRQAQDNNTNPALKHSYADLIDNITSDINTEEQNVSAATK